MNVVFCIHLRKDLRSPGRVLHWFLSDNTPLKSQLKCLNLKYVISFGSFFMQYKLKCGEFDQDIYAKKIKNLSLCLKRHGLKNWHKQRKNTCFLNDVTPWLKKNRYRRSLDNAMRANRAHSFTNFNLGLDTDVVYFMCMYIIFL